MKNQEAEYTAYCAEKAKEMQDCLELLKEISSVFDEESGRVYLGNDGGLYWSSNNGSSWIKINNLPITQFYAFDVSNINPDFMMGGTQDNNTIRTIGGNTYNWQPVLGGDGMYCRINQQLHRRGVMVPTSNFSQGGG